MNRTSLLVLAGALTLAVMLAAGATLVYARAAWNEREPPERSIAVAGVRQRAGGNPTIEPANWPTLRGLRGLRWEIRKAVGPRVEVSEGYRERVLSIAKGDPHVSRLLEGGYNITNVRPIIKAHVNADGSVELRADEALVVLRKGGSIAVALVDLEEGRVTKIIVYTRSLTVIEK